jgi:gliotoxin/aspirochlorine biosynthesis aminotransferase
VRDGISLIAAKNVSSLPTIFSTALLTSSDLSTVIHLNAQRLAAAYATLTTLFRECGIQYRPANAGVFVLARLAPRAKSWEDEAHAHAAYLRAGVLVIPGRAYAMPDSEPGWMRVTFALESSYLKRGLERIKEVYQQVSQ